MRYFAANGDEVSRRLHHVDQMGIAGIANLIKPLDTGVVRIPSRPHHVSRWVTTARLHVRMVETHRGSRKRIDRRRRTPQFASERADRVATHIVNGDQQQIRPDRFRNRIVGDDRANDKHRGRDRNPSNQTH